jgi:hypothetical protein
MAEIKAIETHYKGYRFRSRLEARWAVFFDALDIVWYYEHEGYKTGKGDFWLPDFYLPTFDGGCLVEVKPKFVPKEIKRIHKFILLLGKKVFLAEGLPDLRVYKMLFREDNPAPAVLEYDGIPNADQAYDANRMFVYPGYEEPNGTVSQEYWDCLGTTYLNAVKRAKGARFEHGEKP